MAKTFLLGGLAMGVAALLCKATHAVLPDDLASAIVVPLLETILFLAPACWLLARNKSSTWLFGASDIVLLFACAGAGFSMVESAWMMNTFLGNEHPIFFMSTATVSGDRIRGLFLANDQSIWATLTGISVGLALLVRTSIPWWKALAASGIILCLLDHFSLNSRSTAFAFLGDITRGALLNGYGTLFICLLGIIAAVIVDFRALLRVPRNLRPNAMSIEKFPSLRWWTLERISRRMGYSYFRYMTASEQFKEQAAVQYIGFRNFAISYYRNTIAEPAPRTLMPETAASQDVLAAETSTP
jgi:hypothetical protein